MKKMTGIQAGYLPFEIKKIIETQQLKGEMRRLEQSYTSLNLPEAVKKGRRYSDFKIVWNEYGDILTAMQQTNADRHLENYILFKYDKQQRVLGIKRATLREARNRRSYLFGQTRNRYSQTGNREEHSEGCSGKYGFKTRIYRVFNAQNGLLLMKARNTADKETFKVRCSYDESGRLETTTKKSSKTGWSLHVYYAYDRDGRLHHIRKVSAIGRGKSKETEWNIHIRYDEKGRKLEEKTLAGDGSLISGMRWDYNDKKLKIVRTAYNQKEEQMEITDKITTSKNKDGDIIKKKIEYFKDGKRDRVYAKRYNAHGHPAVLFYEYENRPERNTHLFYEYEYDVKGNWVKRLEYRGQGRNRPRALQTISKQVIKYF